MPYDEPMLGNAHEYSQPPIYDAAHSLRLCPDRTPESLRTYYGHSYEILEADLFGERYDEGMFHEYAGGCELCLCVKVNSFFRPVCFSPLHQLVHQYPQSLAVFKGIAGAVLVTDLRVC